MLFAGRGKNHYGTTREGNPIFVKHECCAQRLEAGKRHASLPWHSFVWLTYVPRETAFHEKSRSPWDELRGENCRFRAIQNNGWQRVNPVNCWYTALPISSNARIIGLQLKCRHLGAWLYLVWTGERYHSLPLFERRGSNQENIGWSIQNDFASFTCVHWNLPFSSWVPLDSWIR